MLYVSIDIETTGLNPETCQVLEIGAVTSNGRTFHCTIDSKIITGEAFALAMNRDLLLKISKGNVRLLRPEKIARAFRDFLDMVGFDDTINVAGKNYTGFDERFLSKLPEWDDLIHVHHRVLDPAMLYLQKGDEYLPSLQTCMGRAGLPGTVSHSAFDDALLVKRLIERKL